MSNSNTPVIEPEVNVTATTPEATTVATPKVSKAKISKTTTPAATTTTTPVVPTIPKPMSGTEMIQNLKANLTNPEALKDLFEKNEALFIKSVMGIKDDFKVLILPTIQTKYPLAAIERYNPKVKYVNLTPAPVQTATTATENTETQA